MANGPEAATGTEAGTGVGMVVGAAGLWGAIDMTGANDIMGAMDMTGAMGAEEAIGVVATAAVDCCGAAVEPVPWDPALQPPMARAPMTRAMIRLRIKVTQSRTSCAAHDPALASTGRPGSGSVAAAHEIGESTDDSEPEAQIDRRAQG